MTKSAWSTWEMKARHGIMASGLGVASTFLGSWLGGKLSWTPHSPLLAHLFAGWLWNAWLWLVFAPVAWGVAKVFPVKRTSFVLLGGVSGFLFLLVLDVALSGFEKFLEFPFYAGSCLFWFATGLVWAWGFSNLFSRSRPKREPGL